MLKWALVFFVVALVAALFGFEVIATGAFGVALALFWIFLGIFVLLLVLALVGKR